MKKKWFDVVTSHNIFPLTGPHVFKDCHILTDFNNLGLI